MLGVRLVTMRLPREGEVDGVHYQFVSGEEFQRLVNEDGLLEWLRTGELLRHPRASCYISLEETRLS